ncbi:MAG: hypothetical protein ACMXYA_01990, partial [Candidatus Woesearchaeota archaeon]
FLSCAEIEKKIAGTDIQLNKPIISGKKLRLDDLLEIAKQQSQFSKSQQEGLYLRQEHNGYLTARAKIVNTEFVQSMNTEHWRARKEFNRSLHPLEKQWSYEEK